MPLTNGEQDILVGRLNGQYGREPIGDRPLEGARSADGTMHDSSYMTSAAGAAKLVSAPVPKSGYELRGAATGVLEIPIPDQYVSGFNFTFGAADKCWGVGIACRALDLGSVPEGASVDGQLLLSTAAQIGTHPTGGADINSIRVGLVLASGAYALRVKWGTSQTDVSLAALDLTRHLGVGVYFRRGVGSNTLEVSAFDGLVSSSIGSIAAAKDCVVRWLHIGGELPTRRPFFGIASPFPCVVSQVIPYTNLVSTSPPAGNPADDGLTARIEVGVSTATAWLDDFQCNGSGDKLTSVQGFTGWIVGNRVHRASGVTAAQTGSIYCDGSGAVMIPRAAKLRKSIQQIPGHYVERDEWSYVVWLDPDRSPWVQNSVERACFTCWSTPYAANVGVSGDPASGSYPDTTRPSEHLRLEIRRAGTNWYIYGFFGELEPQSLKHPTGTAGGSSSTTWPPAMANGGVPPATWNQPEDNPTVVYTDPAGKTAFRVLIGADADVTHPMAYKWLVFAQRKFVAQGSASNACAVFVRRYTSAGALDTGFGEVDDANADANGERHPADQSCFTAARINGNDLSLRPDAYVFSIGAGLGSQLGDEEKSYDATTRLPCVYPLDSDVVPYRLSDQCEAFPYRGGIACPTLVAKWLTARDRLLIATAGSFTTSMLDQFRDSILFSLALEEDAGSIARDARGNDVAYADKTGVAVALASTTVELPAFLGCYPRPEPSWHGEAAPYANEYGSVNGIVQRLGASGEEEVYVVAQAGLYLYSRANHALTRVGTIPGQGGPGQASVTVDASDVIHIAGGPGRPVMVTREKVIAVSGIERPIYPTPTDIITADKTLAGGMAVKFQYIVNGNPLLLAGFEYDDGAIAQFAVGFWSDLLRTRSRPGGRITAQYAAPAAALSIIGGGAVAKYRLSVTGLPTPQGPNAHLVSHWEIYRTDSNGRTLMLERRVPISSDAAVVIGDLQTLGEEADFLRDIPPEAMRTITAFDRRLVGASTPEFPRSIWYTKLDDSGAWPPIYRRNLVQTPSPATGVVVRRDRAFAFSADHMYQLLDGRVDADIGQGIVESVDLAPTVKGCGALSQMAVVDDDQNGIYMPNGKTIYLTEGGQYRSVSQHNDAPTAEQDGENWLWPVSWNLSDGHAFVGFHDERRRMVAIVGPSAADANRRDMLQLFYEQSVMADDGRMIPIGVEMSRVRDVDMTCAASVMNPATKQRETWFGTSRGYLCRFGESSSVLVDYSWLPDVSPRCGFVMAAISTTTVRLEGSFGAYPSTDIFRGAVLRLFRDGEEYFDSVITVVAGAASWVDVTTTDPHGALPGDSWSVGSLPLSWKSGKFDGGSLLQDKSIQSVDVTMVQ